MNPLAILEELDFHPSDHQMFFSPLRHKVVGKIKPKLTGGALFCFPVQWKGKFLARPYLGENMIIT